jgi:hypothetical protein
MASEPVLSREVCSVMSMICIQGEQRDDDTYREPHIAREKACDLDHCVYDFQSSEIIEYYCSSMLYKSTENIVRNKETRKKREEKDPYKMRGYPSYKYHVPELPPQKKNAAS